jgi:hypothetical protein
VVTPDEPVDGDALLVLVLWREANGAWRVRVTRSTHRGDTWPEPTYAATRADVLRAVEEWFDQAVTPP